MPKQEKNKKKWPRWVKILTGIVAVALVVALGVALRYLASINGFLDKITSWGRETKEYSVLVMGGEEGVSVNDDNTEYDYRDASHLQGLQGKDVGFLKTDPKVGNAEQYLQGQVEIEAELYEDTETLVGVLDNGIVAAIVMESDRLEALAEAAGTDGARNPNAEGASVEGSATSEEAGKNMAAMMKEMRVIYTFEIETESETVEATNKAITKEPFVVYISGTDSRAGVKATARSDVNIVAVVNPKTGKILLVSIPRDMYVQLYGTTGLKDKLTHAGVYGIDMSKKTIEDFLGVEIDYTIKVSFATVVELVDQLDGIEINSDKAMRLKVEGKDKTCEYVEGEQWVDGDCALRFARERKSYETGDRHRGENQQQVITGVIGKLGSSSDYVLRLPAILDVAADTFETSFQRDEIMEFIRMQLGRKTKWKVESISVDGTGTYEPTYSMGANLPLYVMQPSRASVQNATAKIEQYLASE